MLNSHSTRTLTSNTSPSDDSHSSNRQRQLDLIGKVIKLQVQIKIIYKAYKTVELFNLKVDVSIYLSHICSADTCDRIIICIMLYVGNCKWYGKLLV
jgi:hypothetical protein